MKKSFRFLSLSAPVVSLLTLLGSGCNHSGAGTPSAVATVVTPTQFVTQLVADANAGTVSASFSATTIAKLNSQQAGYFVIWDSASQSYQAINLLGAEDDGLSVEQMVQAFAESQNSSWVQNNLNANNPFVDDHADDADTIDWACSGPNGDCPVNAVTLSSSTTANPTFVDQDGNVYSQASATRDTDLQQAQLQKKEFLQKAANVSVTYQMSFASAAQLTLLAQTINTNTEQSLTDEDRQAFTQSTLKIAGVSSDEISQAVQASIAGNDAPSNELVSKVANHLGMPSQTILRDRILPSLGVSLSQ